MPHDRPRYAEPLLKGILRHSPIAGIIGQRQTGKTTLAAASSREYETLDEGGGLEKARQNPARFLAGRDSPFTIDECQHCPPLFPALKNHVRLHPGKGQFILTGSVRFTSRRVIRESLTGRIVNVELLPLSYAEARSEALPGFLYRLLRNGIRELPVPSRQALAKARAGFNDYLKTGGLPGICFFRQPHVRATRFETQLETLLERDIRLLVNTQASFRQLRAILAELASRQGLPLSLTALARIGGVTPPTVRKLLSAMEAMFLIRPIPAEGQAHPIVFLEDQGMATYLAPEPRAPERDLVRGLFTNVLPQFLYRPEMAATFFQYRTRGGARVDFVAKTALGRIGVIPVWNDEPTPSSLSSARSFLAQSAGAKAVIAHLGDEIRQISDNLLAVPFPLLLTDRFL